MPEALLFLAVGTIAAVVVAMPILLEDPQRRSGMPGEDRDALVLRHRIAIDALRDVEADRRAGSLDEETYRHERDIAEARAVAARAALDAAPETSGEAPSGRDGRLIVGAIGVLLGLVVGGGVLFGVPVDLANATVTNQALADQMAASAAREEQMTDLRARLQVDPQNTDALAELADLYLATGTQEDRNAAAPLLMLLVSLEPENTDALGKLATAYLQSGQPDDASAVVDQLEALTPESADVAFLRGHIARQRGDEGAAVAAFDAFLAAAPDDPRAPMVRSLRAELTAPASSGAPAPSPAPAG